uniref:Uncharacterized protein n=1 Tax=Octopus bimaculoides TaxID=37653 RepID=A0A0L8FV11_OCTBM
MKLTAFVTLPKRKYWKSTKLGVCFNTRVHNNNNATITKIQKTEKKKRNVSVQDNRCY